MRFAVAIVVISALLVLTAASDWAQRPHERWVDDLVNKLYDTVERSQYHEIMRRTLAAFERAEPKQGENYMFFIDDAKPETKECETDAAKWGDDAMLYICEGGKWSVSPGAWGVFDVRNRWAMPKHLDEDTRRELYATAARDHDRFTVWRMLCADEYAAAAKKDGENYMEFLERCSRDEDNENWRNAVFDVPISDHASEQARAGPWIPPMHRIASHDSCRTFNLSDWVPYQK